MPAPHPSPPLLHNMEMLFSLQTWTFPPLCPNLFLHSTSSKVMTPPPSTTPLYQTLSLPVPALSQEDPVKTDTLHMGVTLTPLSLLLSPLQSKTIRITLTIFNHSPLSPHSTDTIPTHFPQSGMETIPAHTYGVKTTLPRNKTTMTNGRHLHQSYYHHLATQTWLYLSIFSCLRWLVVQMISLFFFYLISLCRSGYSRWPEP